MKSRKFASGLFRTCLAAGAAAPAAALILALAACSLAPAYEQPTAPVAGRYPTGEAYKSSPATAPTSRALAADIGWRDFLSDPRLQRLVEIGLANNRDLRIAALHVAQMRAQYRIQQAQSIPLVDAPSTMTRSRTPASVSTTGHAVEDREFTAGLSADWEIDFFGRLRSLNEEALQQYFASAQAQRAAQILLVAQIADQYLSLLAYEDLEAVTRRTLESSQASFQLTSAQFHAGTGDELALREAQTVMDQAKANYAAQVRGKAQARNALELLIGQPLPADLPPAVPMNDLRIFADLPAGLPSDLLTRRPDIMEAEAQLRGADANIGAARAAFFPTIQLTGGLGAASTSLGGLFKNGSEAWTFAPSISVPVFAGGSLQASLDVAKLQRDAGIAQYEKTIQSAFREVADGLAARGTYDDQVAALERVTDAEQRRLDLATARFRGGVDPYLTVLTAQTDLYSAQQNLVLARLARLTNLVDLYRYLGGGWRERYFTQ